MVNYPSIHHNRAITDQFTKEQFSKPQCSTIKKTLKFFLVQVELGGFSAMVLYTGLCG